MKVKFYFLIAGCLQIGLYSIAQTVQQKSKSIQERK